MNTNTVKLLFATLLAHLMCLTVVLSHMHAKDAVSLLGQQTSFAKVANTDITAKAMGDLHHHIDKAGLKNMHPDENTTAARVRDLKPLQAAEVDGSLKHRIHDMILRLRMAFSLYYQQYA